MKKMFAALLILSVFLAAAACAADSVTVKIGNVLNPDHPWNVALNGFAQDVEKATAGRVVVKVFPSSQLGNEKDLIEGLRMGTVDGGLIGGSSFQSLDRSSASRGYALCLCEP